MRWLCASLVVLAGVGCAEDDPLVFVDPGDLTTDCTGAVPYLAGMEVPATSGDLAVALVEATPSPPDVGDNAWTLEVRDASGATVDDATLSIRPWMPLHGHGISPATYAGTPLGNGQYAIESFDLIMPGLWEFNVTVSRGASSTDTEALVPLCAEG